MSLKTLIVFNAAHQNIALVVNVPLSDYTREVKSVMDALEDGIGWIEAMGEPSYDGDKLRIKGYTDLADKGLGAPYNSLLKHAKTIVEPTDRKRFTTHVRTWIKQSKERRVKVPMFEAAGIMKKVVIPTPEIKTIDTGYTWPISGEQFPIYELNGRYFVRVTRKCVAKVGEDSHGNDIFCDNIIHGRRQLFRNKDTGVFQSIQKVILIDPDTTIAGKGKQGYLCTEHSAKSIYIEQAKKEEIIIVEKPEKLSTVKECREYIQKLEVQIFTLGHTMKQDLNSLKKLENLVSKLEDEKGSIVTASSFLNYQKEQLNEMAKSDIASDAQVGNIYRMLLKSEQFLKGGK